MTVCHRGNFVEIIRDLKRSRNKCAMTEFGQDSVSKNEDLFNDNGYASKSLSVLASKAAFTLAEVLITLGIIGVVAALTLPTLIQNHKKSVVETRLAKFYSTMNQAVKRSEVDNGDIETWEELSNRVLAGWETDEDGNPDKTKPPVALAWYNKYLKNYLNVLKVDYDNNDEGKIKVYFSDGSLMLLSGSSTIFYPDAKNYKLYENDGKFDRERKKSGTAYFTFTFYSAANKWMKNKAFEPYTEKTWNGEVSKLRNDGDIGCQKDAYLESAYCTKLIQMNGWKIPDDYPFKF